MFAASLATEMSGEDILPSQRAEFPLDDLRNGQVVDFVVLMTKHIAEASDTSIFAMMSLSRSIGTSEGIHSLSFRARTHVRAQPIPPRNIHVPSYNHLEVIGNTGVRKKIPRHVWREVDKQIHIAIDAAVITRDRSENCDMHDAALSKFCFVGAKSVEDACE